MRQIERVHFRIPIEVEGKRADGKPFIEKAFTLVIRHDGAQIGLRNSLRPDDRITITNSQSQMSCPFRVVARVKKPLGEGPEWRVECLQPGAEIWGISFPGNKAAWSRQDLIEALLECPRCHSRDLGKLTVDQYRVLITQSWLGRHCAQCEMATEWKFGFIEGELFEAPEAHGVPSSSSTIADRRRTKRRTARLPVRIRLHDGREEITGTENLSEFGTCFFSSLFLEEGKPVRIGLGNSPGDSQKEMEARVVWRRQIEGAGRTIYGLELPLIRNFEQALESLQ